MSLVDRIKSKLLRKKDPTEFWKKRGAKIGVGCEVYPTASFGSEPYLITMGDNVRINSGVQLVTHDGGVWVLRHMHNQYKNIDRFGEIKIGNNVHIGTNSIVMPGVHIGNNCIIGCGAVVTKDIPDNSVAVGVPARVIETIEEYERKNAAAFVNTKSMTYQEKKNFLTKEN